VCVPSKHAHAIQAVPLLLWLVSAGALAGQICGIQSTSTSSLLATLQRVSQAKSARVSLLAGDTRMACVGRFFSSQGATPAQQDFRRAWCTIPLVVKEGPAAQTAHELVAAKRACSRARKKERNKDCLPGRSLVT